MITFNKGRSKFENRIGQDLINRGIPFTYEAKSFKYKIKPYNAKCLACGSTEVYETRSYTPDFFLYNGVIIEAKGRWTARDRKIMLAVRESNPELDIRMLFMNPKVWLTSAHKKNYGDWCTFKGIKWSSTQVPDEWIVS